MKTKRMVDEEAMIMGWNFAKVTSAMEDKNDN